MWAYDSADPETGEISRFYGCPVSVYIAELGERVTVAYQFEAPTQRCAVVHVPTGRVIAPVLDHHAGYPQERAQAAVDERMAAVKPGAFTAAVKAAPILNAKPRVVGVMRGDH